MAIVRDVLICALLLVSAASSYADGIPRSGSFAARWTTTGHIESLAFANGREAYVTRHRGELFLTRREGLPRALSSDCLGFGERGGLGAGRCAFADTDGDQIFVEISSVGLTPRQPITGRIVGGSGKYQGIGGEISSAGWRYGASTPGESQVQAFMDDLTGHWQFE